MLGLLAVSFATKETTYITVVRRRHVLHRASSSGSSGEARRAGRRPRRAGSCATSCRSARRVDLGRRRRSLVVFTLLFTTFLTNPHGLRDGLVEQHRLLALAAAGQPRRPAVVLLPRPHARRTSGRSLFLAAIGIVAVAAAADAARALPRLDVRRAASWSTRGRRSGCRGSSSTRSCRCPARRASASRRVVESARRALAGKAGLAVVAARRRSSRLRRPISSRVRPAGRPARAARLHVRPRPTFRGARRSSWL